MEAPDFDRLLDEAVAVTHVEQFRWLCSSANVSPPPNDRDTWRQFIASGRWRAAYPSLTTQAGNALKAVGQAIGAGFARVDPTERDRRLAICHECEHYDPAQDRCRVCGCKMSWKALLEAWHCPLPEPKW